MPVAQLGVLHPGQLSNTRDGSLPLGLFFNGFCSPKEGALAQDPTLDKGGVDAVALVGIISYVPERLGERKYPTAPPVNEKGSATLTSAPAVGTVYSAFPKPWSNRHVPRTRGGTPSTPLIRNGPGPVARLPCTKPWQSIVPSSMTNVPSVGVISLKPGGD